MTQQVVTALGDYPVESQRRELSDAIRLLESNSALGSVIDREAFNEGLWPDSGGFVATNRVFDGKLRFSFSF